jgi:putative secretion ATPase (PEP-CTERM system associated)
MYESYYGLSGKPFSLRPDPHFFFGSKGHARAMAYLEYGLSQGEGFIVVTGDIGAGKTMLVRTLFRQIDPAEMVVAHIVNTHLNSDDTLKMVLAGFGLGCDDGASKPTMLARLERFLQDCGIEGKRALLVIDEAQNLTPRVVEELRMLSNFQTDDKSLLQTFLLGQPEFRATLHRPDMHQLRQRVIATYHLGPIDEAETRAYVEHRLATVGWRKDAPSALSFTAEAHAAIYAYSGGIPRKTNHLCDRLLLMGFLEEIRHFTGAEVQLVVRDIEQEAGPVVAPGQADASTAARVDGDEADGLLFANQYPPMLDERILKLEKALGSVLTVLRKIVRAPANLPIDHLE